MLKWYDMTKKAAHKASRGATISGLTRTVTPNKVLRQYEAIKFLLIFLDLLRVPSEYPANSALLLAGSPIVGRLWALRRVVVELDPDFASQLQLGTTVPIAPGSVVVVDFAGLEVRQAVHRTLN